MDCRLTPACRDGKHSGMASEVSDSAPCRAFELDAAGLETVRASLHEAIRAGLEEDGLEVRAFPAYLPAPRGAVAGTAVVLDIGGTNMRAAVVELGPGDEAQIVAGPIAKTLDIRECPVDGRTFFAMQAELIGALDPPAGVPVGYCFSYPSEAFADRDSALIKWAKGIDIPEVVGQRVGAGLSTALTDAGLRLGPMCVLNDTVAAAVLGAARFAADDPSNVIGLIVGTGTNMAGFFTGRTAPKLESVWPQGKMAVNLETGNFTMPTMTPYDHALDATSSDPGHQRFEKAISGYYLPFLFGKALPGHLRITTAELSKLAAAHDDSSASRVARAILTRSADLAAAGLAAAIDIYETTDCVGIQAEGGLYWGAPGYAARVEATLADLLGAPDRFRILRAENANLFGSAVAALTP